MKNENTYDTSEVTENGAKKYTSDIHGVGIRINQYVWDMMKILKEKEMYGFHFQVKVGKEKVMVILWHNDKEQLAKGKEILRNVERDKNIIFLSKIKKEKSNLKIKIILFLITLLIFITLFIANHLYQKGFFDKYLKGDKPKIVLEHNRTTHEEPIVKEIVVDIEKLKLLKESFEEENSTVLTPNVMKSLELTTTIISEMVSDEEKEKYSSEELVKNFKGKGGFKLVVKKGEENGEFNATVKELNSYAEHFIKENNLSLALKLYDKAKEENNLSKEELMVNSFQQAEIFKEMGLNEKAKIYYEDTLKLTKLLKDENLTQYALSEVVTLTQLSVLEEDIMSSEKLKNIDKEVENLYSLLIAELKKEGMNKEEELALALNYLANFYTTKNRDYLSIEIRKKALVIYTKLIKKKPKKFDLIYYKTLNSLAHSYLKVQKIELAKENYLEALKFMKQIIKSKKFKNRAYIAVSYRALATLSLAEKKFIKAKKYDDDALTIYNDLAKRKKQYKIDIIEMHGEFATLYRMQQNFKLAQKEYQKGIFKFSQIAKQKPLKYNLKIANLLNELAIMNLSLPTDKKRGMLFAKMELRESILWAKKVIEINFKKSKESMAKSYAYLAYIEGVQKDMTLALEYYNIAYSLKQVHNIKAFKLLDLNLD